MKQKIIIVSSVLLLLAALFFIGRDFFYEKNKNKENQYEYDLSNLKETDSSQICYREVSRILPESDNLYAIATDNKDRIYIAGNEKILVYESNGNLLETIELKEDASAIKISPDAKIYLAMNDHVEVLDSMGVLQDSWDSPNDKAIFTSIDASETDVFVADAGNKIVYHYNTQGELMNEIGRKDSLKGIPGFIIPSPFFDLAIGRDDELWVVNSGRHAFEAYDFTGSLISSWERTSMSIEGFSGCCNPTHMAILSNGSFVTSEKGLERVKIHLPSGDYDCLVAGPESFDEGTKGIDLAVDSKDRIILLDPYNGNVRIYEKL
ncbi:MAG: hypothetical protein ISR55_01455 [Bacteroidetes bacterium]|nr:hypothetical protein [Bacteroidota bacterium]